MALRTRLTLIFIFVLGIVITGLWLTERFRDSVAESELSRLTATTQTVLWNDILQDQANGLMAKLRPVAAALADGDTLKTPAAAAEILSNAVDNDESIEQLQLFDTNGQMIRSTDPGIGISEDMDPLALARLKSGEGDAVGFRYTSDGDLVFSATIPIMDGNSTAAYLSALQKASHPLNRFARQLGVEAFLIDPRGHIIDGTDLILWRESDVRIELAEPAVYTIDVGDQRYVAISIPVDTAVGGLAGTLVTFKDATQDLSAVARLERTSTVLFALFIAAVIGFFYLYLRSAFRPIESSVNVLDALSAGDVEVEVDSAGGGEARQIAEAVTVFRENVLAVRDQRQQAARRLNRQERLIRRQLQDLAATLDPDGRREILADLDGLLDQPKSETDTITGAPDTQLFPLARVLERLSGLITDQHNRLTELVAELRESLVTKTRLAALEQQLEIARALQQSFLPAPLPADPRFDLDALMVPAFEVGGDFYDFYKYDESRLALTIADVSGKGIPAAFFMAITRTQLRAAAFDHAMPGAVLGHTNAVLAADNDEMMFTTLFFGLVDLETGVVTYANAGHNRPFILRRDGAVEEVPSFGEPALAVVPNRTYGAGCVTLAPGDTLFLYTDGVSEAMDGAHVAFGEPRLMATLETVSSAQSPAAIDQAVYDAVKAHEAGAGQADDITCLTFRYRGSPAA